MKTQNLYSYHDQFIYRTPLFYLQRETLDLNTLFDISKQPIFKEAIYLASPTLFDELIKWHNYELKNKKEIEKLIISIYKYYTRIRSRCTPYGLFATCAMGKWGNKSEIVLDDIVKRHTRLDMNYLCTLTQQLNINPVILPLLQFYPNNSIYLFGGQLRYLEYKYFNNRRVHEISGVDYSSYLQLILDKAKSGALIIDLEKLLIDIDITFDEAKEFINELIINQILVSELEPAVTGEEFIYQLINLLKKLNIERNDSEIESIIQLLSTMEEQIKAIDKELGNNISIYRKIYHSFKMLGSYIEENQFFQTDLFKSSIVSSIDSYLKDNLMETIDFLNKFSFFQETPNLKKFKENFFNQYEDAEMSLLEVLDTETGIGYKGKDTSGLNDLLDDIFVSLTGQQSVDIRWNKIQQLLQNKLLGAIKNDDFSVVFKDEDLKDFDNQTNNLPDSLAIKFRLIDAKNIYFESCGGSSAANLLGRFAHGDEKIHEVIMDITSHEQSLNEDKILAEIVHLPERRIGNILLRPVFREYEIPYLGKSALPADKQIPLEDLMVSVKNNKIILRSRKLNKEVIPRLSTAHNYSMNALPAYQFLCDIQTQYFEKSGFGFSWGALSGSYKFLPRAEYKNVVLSRAKWQFQKSDFQILLDSKKENYKDEIIVWRKHWNIPDYVVLADGDNELLINFNDELSLKMLVSTIKKRNSIVLEEFLFDVDNLLVKDEKGNGYTNEIIAILLKNKKEEQSATNNIPIREEVNSKLIQRDFIIGSEWLYYKFYCGIKTAEKVLIEAISPLTEELVNKGWVDKFFFIRYSDPDFHIRLRLHITNINDIGKIVAIINHYFQPYIEQRLIHKIQTDTYKRELERYGLNSMELSESFFHIDSIATLNLLGSISGNEGDVIRWQFALRSIDELLNSFKFSATKKMDFIKKLKMGFIEEHGGGKELKVQLDNKFRKLRKEVESVLNTQLEQMREFFPLTDLLIWKNEQLRPIAEEIIKLETNNQLLMPMNDLITSYTHIMMNRIFKARQRTCEMVVYDLLFKYYKSTLAKEKNRALSL